MTGCRSTLCRLPPYGSSFERFAQAHTKRFANRLQIEGSLSSRLTSSFVMCAIKETCALAECAVWLPVNVCRSPVSQHSRSTRPRESSFVRRPSARARTRLRHEQKLAACGKPRTEVLRSKRDRAIPAVLLGCRLCGRALADLKVSHLQRQEGHWVIVDLVGKVGTFELYVIELE